MAWFFSGWSRCKYSADFKGEWGEVRAKYFWKSQPVLDFSWPEWQFSQLCFHKGAFRSPGKAAGVLLALGSHGSSMWIAANLGTHSALPSFDSTFADIWLASPLLSPHWLWGSLGQWYSHGGTLNLVGWTPAAGQQNVGYPQKTFGFAVDQPGEQAGQNAWKIFTIWYELWLCFFPAQRKCSWILFLLFLFPGSGVFSFIILHIILCLCNIILKKLYEGGKPYFSTHFQIFLLTNFLLKLIRFVTMELLSLQKLFLSLPLTLWAQITWSLHNSFHLPEEDYKAHQWVKQHQFIFEIPTSCHSHRAVFECEVWFAAIAKLLGKNGKCKNCISSHWFMSLKLKFKHSPF